MSQVTSFIQIDFPPCHSNSIMLLEAAGGRHVRCCAAGQRQEPFACPAIISVNNNVINDTSTFSASIVFIKIEVKNIIIAVTIITSGTTIIIIDNFGVILVVTPSCPPQEPGLCPPCLVGQTDPHLGGRVAQGHQRPRCGSLAALPMS